MGVGRPRRSTRAPRPDMGSLPMENTLLIGLSRQIALQRELDVVANNVANMNTTGYKADGAIFEEYLMPQRSGCRLPGRRPACELRAGPRHLARFRLRPDPADRQPARCRHRRRCLLRGADPARRALHAQRRIPDQCAGRARDQHRRPRDRRRRTDPVPVDRQQHLDQSGRHHHGARGQQFAQRFGARQAAPRPLRQRPAAAEGRHHACSARQQAWRRRRRGRRHGSSKARSSNRTSIR